MFKTNGLSVMILPGTAVIIKAHSSAPRNPGTNTGVSNPAVALTSLLHVEAVPVQYKNHIVNAYLLLFI